MLSHRRSATVLMLVAASQAAPAAGPAAAAEPCPNAVSRPGEVSYATLGRATLCLVNRERLARRLVALRANGRLTAAAQRHGRDMVRHAYFAHESRSGAPFTSRIRAAGYLRRVRSWRAGENIAWGRGERATPREIVRAWMESPPHRANVLGRSFRDLGVGVAPGAPVPERYGSEATYVHDFGVRG